jgi:integrase
VGHTSSTPSGNWRANWRDPSGKQKAKTFKTKKAANAYLAEVESSKNRGAYIDPDASKVLFETFAGRWLLGREVEARTAERTLSLLRAHVLPRWGKLQLCQIDYMSVQEWVVALGKLLAPPTVSKCYGLLVAILDTAVRARILPFNPAAGVKVRRDANDHTPPRASTITRGEFFTQLLPAVPVRHRAIVGMAALAGLRWGECAGLLWGSINLGDATVRVAQVAEETHQGVTLRPYPKTKAGVRTAPLPSFLLALLRAHLKRWDGPPEPTELVFPNRYGQPMRRSNFRREVWALALARAGLPATLRFHDLRHSYATWLVTDGVPINVVQRVMGHANASTTLDRYTHAPSNYADAVRAAFDDLADETLTFPGKIRPDDDDDGETPVPVPA